MGNTFNKKRVTIKNKLLNNKKLQTQKDTVQNTISTPLNVKF